MTKLKQPIYHRLALIGAGLIGGSIARAARMTDDPMRPQPITAIFA